MSTEHDGDRPAFPPMAPLESWGSPDRGLTAREHAAIQLRVPDSGQPWLDDMIREAWRMDAAQAAMQGILAGGFADTIPHDDINGGSDASGLAQMYADALLSAICREW